MYVNKYIYIYICVCACVCGYIHSFICTCRTVRILIYMPAYTSHADHASDSNTAAYECYIHQTIHTHTYPRIHTYISASQPLHQHTTTFLGCVCVYVYVCVCVRACCVCVCVYMCVCA